MSLDVLVLIGITLVGATVNGALGYGFSSLTVPVALLFYTNRILNPALVIIEVVLNAYVVWTNRSGLPRVWRRVLPIVLGLFPGVAVGTSLVSTVDPEWVKFATYGVLIPLILLQAAGFRRPIRAERRAGLVFGSGVGVLYSVTTISGPPLAVLLSNQGLAREDFRAGLGVVRLAESSLTATAYLLAGLYTVESLSLIGYVVPSVLIGIPVGTYLIRHVQADMFRRLCMSFDAWIVGFGLSTVAAGLGMVDGGAAYLILAAVVVTDLMIYRWFPVRARAPGSG